MNRARKPLLAGNWKMFHGGPTACDLAAAIAEGVARVEGVEVVVAPPVTALAAVAHELDGQDVGVAAQNMHAKDTGAFTGEVSGPMLLACGATWVILGHSERRQLFGETDGGVGEKTASALRHGLAPIVCVGETLEERDAGKTLEVIERQLAAALPHLAGKPGVGVVAYEPVWAIGTGRVATAAQAQEAHAALRAQLQAASPDLALRTRILYGGSVKPDNADELLACPDVDGALVGGASLEAVSFLAIVRAAAKRLGSESS